jgi:hypothetical protein
MALALSGWPTRSDTVHEAQGPAILGPATLHAASGPSLPDSTAAHTDATRDLRRDGP